MQLPPSTPESKRAFIAAVLANDSHRMSVAVHLRGLADQRRRYGSFAAADDCEALADLFEHAEHPYPAVEDPWWELFRINPEQHGNNCRSNMSIERVGV